MEPTGTNHSLDKQAGFLSRVQDRHEIDSSTQWKMADISPKFDSNKMQMTSLANVADLSHFHDAVKSGNESEVLQLLAQCPALLELKDEHQNDALHLAAMNGHVDVLQALLARSPNLNSKDASSNTSLHLVASGNNPTIATLLLTSGADPEVINNAGDTPLHLAVRCGSLEVLQVLLLDFKVDVNLPGWNGETPLHIAASQNHVECANLLVLNGADTTRRCSSGGQAIHYAVSFGALDVVRYLLSIPDGIYAVNQIEDILKSIDGEESTPLHLAVSRGDLDTASILLEAGAPLASQMFELSTPLHIACALGATDIVLMMHAHNWVDFEKVLCMQDAQGMTPVHRAAMFDHWSLLRSLIDKGGLAGDASLVMNGRDTSGRTALVLAASRGSWHAVSELLNCGADPLICCNDGQNFLHSVVAVGGDPEAFKDELRQNGNFAVILNGKDNAGDAPLHYAARFGFGSCCDTLIKLGALVGAKNRNLKTPLHLAAEFGRYTTLKELLMYVEGQGVVNDMDIEGRTPLHLAAKNGHLKIVLLLTSKGSLMVRDLAGALPLHLACAEDKTDIVETLLSSHGNFLNTVDKRGNTPLHIAAENNAAQSVAVLLKKGAQSLANNDNLTALDLAIMFGHQKVADIMVESERWKELMLQPSTLYKWPSYGLIQEFPDTMMKVLDKCQWHSSENHFSKDYCLRYDYSILQPDLDQKSGQKDRDYRKPLEVLNQMTHWKRIGLLSHSVCKTYLQAKWRSYGLVLYITTMILYLTFLTLLTYLVLDGIECDLRPNLRLFSKARVMKHKPELLENSTRIGPVDLSSPEGCVTVTDQTLLAFVISFALIHLLKKVAQLRREGLAYFIRLITMFELTLYVSTMLFCIGFFDVADHYMTWEVQWLLGAVSIFFAWVNLFFYLRRYGEVGMHVMILLRTMEVLTEAMVVLFVVVVAFAITFFTLNPAKILPDHKTFYDANHDGDAMMDIYWTSYSNLQAAILRVSDQMVGDADVIANFVDPILNGQMVFPATTYMFAMFSIPIITILLQSMIIGLTVGRIRDLRESVALVRLVMQVDLHTEIEENLPVKFMKSWDIPQELTVFPNRRKSRFVQQFMKFFSATAEKKDIDSSTLKMQKSSLVTPESNNHEHLVEDLSAKADQQQELLRMIIQRLNIPIQTDVLDDDQYKGMSSLPGNNVKWERNLRDKVKV